MVRAHSLLYAVYVCLIVSIICGALLYMASLYSQLNLFYNVREDLYLQNQSAVNYALGSSLESPSYTDETTGVEFTNSVSNYGVLKLLKVETANAGDTLQSIHFVGQYASDGLALYLPKSSRSLSYAGTVKIIGEKMMPSESIRMLFINNEVSELTEVGKYNVSEDILPALSSSFINAFENTSSRRLSLKDLKRENDSVYFNSFNEETLNVWLSNSVLSNIVIKGNIILHAKDSIFVKSTAVLEDVILKAPKISFEGGFKGSVQAFCTEEIKLGKAVNLEYPSLLCIKSSEISNCKIQIGSGTKITGAVVLFGNPITKIDDNIIVFEEKTLLVGNVYSTGKVNLKGRIFGGVYASRFISETSSSKYENCLLNCEIDVSKRPEYMVSIPLFQIKNDAYGLFKKVL